MSKRIIRELSDKISENGFAFHGTPAGNLPQIRKEGIIGSDGAFGYLVPGRSILRRNYSDYREIWEKTVGAAQGAANYGCKSMEEQPDENTHADFLPAIVLVRRDGPERGTDEGHLIPAYRRKRSDYPSFGKVWSPNVPKKNIAAIVRLTRKEYLRICRKYDHPWYRTSAIQAKISVKALTKLKQIIEKEAKKQ